jgi:hypothetical protein
MMLILDLFMPRTKRRLNLSLLSLSDEESSFAVLVLIVHFFFPFPRICTMFCLIFMDSRAIMPSLCVALLVCSTVWFAKSVMCQSCAAELFLLPSALPPDLLLPLWLPPPLLPEFPGSAGFPDPPPPEFMFPEVEL